MRASPLAVTAVVDGVTTVLTPDMRFLKLDELGTVIWEGITEGLDLDGIVERITAAYAVDAATARADAERFIDDLRAEGLLVDDA